MNLQDKKRIRAFMLSLLCADDVREKLDSLPGIDADPFEAMEFYEEQVERIDKMFNFPNQETAFSAQNRLTADQLQAWHGRPD